MMCADYRHTTSTAQYQGFLPNPLFLDHYEQNPKLTTLRNYEPSIRHMSVVDWDMQDCADWVINVCRQRGVDEGNIQHWAYRVSSGTQLLRFTLQDFCACFGNDMGEILHEEFQEVLRRRNERENEIHDSDEETHLVIDLDAQPIDLSKRRTSTEEHPGHIEEGCEAQDVSFYKAEHEPHFSAADIESEDNSDYYLHKISTNRKRNRGPKSWEFLMRLLADERTNPSLIRWEDESTSTFRLIQPHIIAKLWGKRSGKPELSYNNFARALRYHYKSGQLMRVSERQLVYRCGADALTFLNQLSSKDQPEDLKNK